MTRFRKPKVKWQVKKVVRKEVQRRKKKVKREKNVKWTKVGEKVRGKGNEVEKEKKWKRGKKENKRKRSGKEQK